jgi:hypothetical protein
MSHAFHIVRGVLRVSYIGLARAIARNEVYIILKAHF